MTLYRAQMLANCDQDLMTLFTRVGQQRDTIIVQGARTVAAEVADMAAGKSSLKNPLDSKHVIDPNIRPVALAVDAAPYPIDWQNIPAFEDFGEFVKEQATILGIAIVWGGDWTTLKDYDHFELAHAHAQSSP